MNTGVDLVKAVAEVQLVRGRLLAGLPLEDRRRHVEHLAVARRGAVSRQERLDGHHGLNVCWRECVIVHPNIIDAANPVTAPPVRTDENRGVAAENLSHGG
jgi:hypothetical protein